MQKLSGIRVLEVGEFVGAPCATKLLADLGAEVIKIEPPEGDRARRHGPFPPDAPGDIEQSGLFLGLNTNKKSVVLSLDDEAGRSTLAELVAEADIVVHDLSAERAATVGLDAAMLLERHPSLVVCAITPFGHTGPQAEWLAEEINVVHGGGWGWLIPGDAPDHIEPLMVAGYTAHYQAATVAAFAALGCYYRASADGTGDFVDVSVLAHVSALAGEAFIGWSYLGDIAGRSGTRRSNPWRIYEAGDGPIFLAAVEADQWDRLVDMMGRPEWALHDDFATNDARTANAERLDAHIEEWTKQHPVEELFHEGQARRICFAPVYPVAGLADQPQLEGRGFYHQLEHPIAGEHTYLGAAYKMTPDPWQLRSAAPLLGEHNGQRFSSRPGELGSTPAAVDSRADGRRPLEGLRIVDFSWVWAGPFATMHLSALGAEVIKVESSGRPGLGRRHDYHPPGVERTLNTCGYFNQWEQGKKSLDVDLKDPAGLEIVRNLIATADVVIDNFATGVMERLGLGDDVLRAANPNVILTSISGFGRTGPMKDYIGYGAITGPMSGLTSMTGHPGGRLEQDGLAIGDPAAGVSAALAITAALIMRRRGDDPARIDISLWEATAVNAVDAWMGHVLGAPAQPPMGSRHPVYAPHGVFPCEGDDKWLSIACSDDAHWRALAALIDDDLVNDVRFASRAGRKQHESDLEAIIADFTRSADRWRLARDLQAVGVPAYPTLDSAELEINEQLVERKFWERLDHPETGPMTHVGVAWRTLRAPSGIPRRAPLVGEHTVEVVESLRGRTSA